MRVQFKFNRSLRRELAPGDRRLWLLRSVALRIERHTNPLWAFEVFHRRLAVALGVLSLTGYLLTATGLFLWLDRQPQNQVRWVDLAAPWRWSDLRARRGDSAIAAGQALLREEKYPDAFYQLRVGLARAPGNLEGRLTLFRLFAGYDPTRALTLLEDGLAYAPDDPNLVGPLLDFYGYLQAHERALATVDRLLPDQPEGAVREMLLRMQISLLLVREQLAEAEAALAALPAPKDPAGPDEWIDLRLDLLRRSGRLAEARTRAETVLADSGASVRVLRQVGELAVAGDDTDLLQSVIRRLRAREPESPTPYLYAIQSMHRLKRASLRDAYLREYLGFFGRQDAGLQALAALAVNLDLPDLVSQTRQVAVQAGFSPFAYQVHLTELALRAGDTDTAMRTLRDWEQAVETLEPRQRFHPEFIKRLTRAAFVGTPDQTTAVLGHLAANRAQGQLTVYLLAVTVLEQAKQGEAASQLVRAGLQVYPYSEPLLAAARRLEPRSDPARPAASVPPPGELLPGSGPETLERLDRQLAAAEYAAARDLLRNVRAGKPDWLPEYDEAVSLREIELAGLVLEPLAGRALARTHLDRFRSEAAVQRLAALAGRLAGQDRSIVARLLADELTAMPTTSVGVREALQALGLAEDKAGHPSTQADVLAALDRHLAAADWVAAERVLRQLTEQPPAWLDAGFNEVKSREVLVRLGLGQPPQALSALKELVVKGGAARSAAFKLVRDLLARGELDSAKVLAREILRLLPDNPAAVRLLEEAEAPRGA